MVLKVRLVGRLKPEVRARRSLVVYGGIKVVGITDFPRFCGDELYMFLEENFPL